jgi:tetratricopeptide (TPR) repeat protein
LLEKLVDEHPAVPDYRHLLALCHREVSARRWFRRDFEASAEAANKATGILQELVQECPDVPDYRHDLCKTYMMLQFQTGFPPGVADPLQHGMLDKALAICEELVAEHPNVPDYAVSQIQIRFGLAGTLWKTDPPGAETHLRKALALQSSLVRRFPRNFPYRAGMDAIHDALRRLLQQTGRSPEARSMLEASITSLKELLENDPKAGFLRGVLGMRYLDLAKLLREMGEEQAAADAERQAEALRPRWPNEPARRSPPP